MDTTELLKKIKLSKITFADAFVELSKNGTCPNLLNDDAGRWAVCFDGFQTVPSEETTDINTSFFVEKDKWKDSPTEALIYALENE